MRSNNAYITTHHFNTGETTGECAAIIYDETFRTDTNKYRLIINASSIHTA